ncbi:P-loop containing nucleoside triphosphate hydrolase protein [Baffinella frigidus]|nr:P-loop containing nucleoside triphosphate hydrolase protein [Cryptophyta sp. CCMP2293]
MAMIRRCIVGVSFLLQLYAAGSTESCGGAVSRSQPLGVTELGRARGLPALALRLRGGKKEKTEKKEKKERKEKSSRGDKGGEDDGGDGEGVSSGKVLKRGRKEKKESVREEREASPRMETRSMSPRSASPAGASDSKAPEKKSRKRDSKDRKDRGGKEEKRESNANKTLVSHYRISSATAKALEKQGITSLFPIQVATFDHIYDGADLIARALTGTGKTLGFVLPVNERLLALQDGPRMRERGRAPLAVVMVPTRELCVQVTRVWESIAPGLQVISVYGGAPIHSQSSALRSGVDAVVGTPGRMIDLLERKALSLSSVKFLIMDEADQMLEIGFKEEMEKIIRGVCFDPDDTTKNKHQTMLFSATVPSWVQSVARKYLKGDKRKDVDLVTGQAQQTASKIRHLKISCGHNNRRATIGAVIDCYAGRTGRTIVFTETKVQPHGLLVNNVFTNILSVLYDEDAVANREVSLQGFRDGTIQCLVATNVAARGLDIPEVDLVIMCHPPDSPETYVHRSGRTGRAGRSGTCIVFYGPREAGVYFGNPFRIEGCELRVEGGGSRVKGGGWRVKSQGWRKEG